MRVTINYCDGCGKDCVNTSMEDLFGSRTFFFKDANADSREKFKLTLCADCKKQLYYMLENHEVFKRERENMRLGNRIRFLLKMPLKEG